LVCPEEAGIGAVPVSLANAPSDRSRSGLSAGVDQQRGGGVDPDPTQRDELGCGRGDQPSQLPVEILDLGIECPEAAREFLHRVAGGGGHGVRLVAGSEHGRDRDPLAGGPPFELLAQRRWCGHGQGLQLVGHLATGNDRRLACNPQHTDHLHVPGTRLRCDRGLAGEDLAGRGFGIDRVGLADVAAKLAVRPVDLDHRDATLTQPAAQAGAVRAGPLDPDGVDRAELAGPAVQLSEPGRGGGELELVESASELVERDRDVNLLVVSTPRVTNTSASGIVGIAPSLIG
jgi:hypothetical protein